MQEVARLLGVSRNTVRRWTDEGRLASYRSPGGHRRYLRDEVAAAIAAGRTGGPAAEAGGEGEELLASVRRQLATLDASLDAALDLLGSLPSDASGVSHRIAETLTTLTGLSSCEVATLGHDGLRVVASVAGGGRVKEREGARLDEGPRRRLVDDATATSPGEHPYVLVLAGRNALGDDARRMLGERHAALLLVVPLLVEGTFAGTLELCDDAPR
ncbi:MAG TPA: helix-turn-helix domain-containing protein, partial [Thermoleophilia bacterium]|nr:helix-turn-helix domain-containing protein [Thermoleophilia bacterium]